VRSQPAARWVPEASLITETRLSMPRATSSGRVGSDICSTRLPKSREISSPPGQNTGAQPVQTSIRQSEVCS
jgi:hypothetical protein